MLRKLEPASANYRVFDDSTPGLFLEVLTSGLKKWRFRRGLEGRRRQVTLGTFPELTVADARRLAAADPLPLRSPTFGDLARAWLESLGESRGRPGPEMAAGLLDGTIRPALGDVEASLVTGADILDRIIRPLLDGGDLEGAERARLVCGRIFSFGVAAGLVRGDPVEGLPEFDHREVSGRFASNIDPMLGEADLPDPALAGGTRPHHYAVKRNPRLVGLPYDPCLPHSSRG